MECPICYSSKNNQVYEKLPNSITSDSEFIEKEVSNVICIECGHVFNESGSRNQVISFYGDSYKLHEETEKAEFKYFSNGQNITHQDLRLQILEDNIQINKEGKILDVGCGKGNFLLAFTKKFPYWQLYGVEISKSALEFAKKILPQALLHGGLFNNEIFKEKFDLIIAHGILEHLELPNSFLKCVLSCLKDSGIMFIEVPNFKLNPADLFTYDHLSHFTKETLQNLFNLHGIEIIGITESSERIPLSVICRKSERKKPLINHYALMKKITEEHTKFNESMFHTYEKATNKFNEIGVFGLGEIGLAGIQKGKLNRRKIKFFFDENDLIIGTQKLGIEIKHLAEITKFPNLQLVLSVSPCYIQNIINKLDNVHAKYSVPENYDYYKIFFNNTTK